MKKFLNLFGFIGTACVVVVVLLSIQFYFFIKNPLPVGQNGYVLVVPLGTPVPKIVENLHKAGIVNYPNWLLLYIKWQGAWGKLKAGEYLIKEGTTPTELIQQLVDGRVIQYALTVVEGWNFDRMMEEIHQAPKLTHTLLGLENEQIMAKIGHSGEHPEGRFLPETYYFPAGTTDVAFLKRAYDLMHLKLQEAWQDRTPDSSLSLQSPYEALILASIIEKESSVPEEYAEISGVYHRRLVKKMLLQADPTVIYGLGKSYNGNLDKAALQKETPYNTYKKIGLPPTPIAMPSLKSLQAATHPTAGETLYFVAKAEGKGHIFSKTLEEHNLAVKRYRKSAQKELGSSPEIMLGGN